MQTPLRTAFGSAIALLLLLVTRVAAAETIMAPTGGRSVPIGGERVGCPDSLAGSAWTLDPDGKSVKPPAREDAIGQVTSLRVAPNAGVCPISTATIALVAVGARGAPDAGSVVVDVDAGRVTMRGRRLKGAVLAWRTPKPGEDTCVAPDTTPAGDTCAFAVARDLSADPSTLTFELWPPGARPLDDATLYDANARRTSPDDLAVRPSQIVLSRLFSPDSAIDVSSGTGHLPLLHPDAVGAIDCADATCDVTNGELVVRNEHGSDEKLDVHVQLRPRVVLRAGATTDPAPVVSVPLQRCPVTLASPAPYIGASDQRIVLRVGVACTRGDAELEYATDSGRIPVERSEVVGADHFVVLHLGARLAGDSTVRIRRRGTVVGLVPLSTRPLSAVRARVELPDFGPVDFIPTNRWAKLTLPPATPPGELVALPTAGAYDIKRDAAGTWIRGADGASGAVLLRFGYVDKELPPALQDLSLASFVEPVDRPLKVANVPVALGALARGSNPLVEVQCGDGNGHLQRMSPQMATFIPYRARDTCQLVIHQEQLTVEDGAQAFQVSIQVTASDGGARSEASVSKRLVLKKGDKPTYIAVAGATAPFDHILVRAGLADDETHYAVPVSEKGAQVQWSIVTGTDHIRIYGTAAIPTGLFRVADKGHSGILTLSVGALLRAVWLSKEGTEFPVGLEAGVMWLGVAGDTDPAASSRGAVAVVAGPGIAVPIANVGRATQTSISLHAWFEYEVSRTVLGQSGQPFGFVFGPSISIGDVGTNL